MMSSDMTLSTALAALQRIARKPWPITHKHVREFYDLETGRLRRVRVHTPAERETLWRPAWAGEEYNPCDCPNCIAKRVLSDIKAAYEAELVGTRGSGVALDMHEHE